MKRIKFIVFSILAVILFFYNSENFQDYIREFENGNDFVTFYAPAETTSEEMLNDLSRAADESNISFFITDYVNLSTFSSKKTIYYSSQDVIDYINSTYYISDGNYKSIIGGKTEVKFESINNIENLTTYNCFWLIGSREEQRDFKNKLIVKYGGSIPREGFSYDGILQNSIKMCIILFVISLFISLFQIISYRKEALVRIINGESIIAYITGGIFNDFWWYCFLFAIIYFLMSILCYTNFCITYVLLAFMGMLIINSLLYLCFLKFNIKRDLSKTRISNKLLFGCYALKLITSVLIISIITLNSAVIFEGISFYSQKHFFESVSEYSYVNNKIRFPENTEENDLINAKYKYKFYQHFTRNGNALMQVYLGDVSCDNVVYPIVYMNKNNLKYLLNCIPELDSDSFTDDKVYYLFPQQAFTTNCYNLILHDTDEWVRWNLEMHYNYQYEYTVLCYQDGTNILALSNQFEMHSDYVQNPIIAFNNRDESQDAYNITSDIRDIYDRDIMYIINKEDILELERQFGYNTEDFLLEITNVYDDYLIRLDFIKRITYINTAITLLVIIMNIVVTVFIITIEYSVNKIDLAVKKTLGYSRFERFKKLHLLSFITTALGSFILLGINILTHISNSFLIVLCGLIVSIMDFLIIMFFSKKADNENIRKILNGG